MSFKFFKILVSSLLMGVIATYLTDILKISQVPIFQS